MKPPSVMEAIRAFRVRRRGEPDDFKGVSLSFDPEDRLTSYWTAMTTGYDGNGFRAWKSSDAGKTYFVYDGDAPVLETDSSGNVTAFNVWGANGLLSRRLGAASIFHTLDPQGSVVQRLDINQIILSISACDAWGNPLIPNPCDPFGCEAQSGYYTDIDIGLILRPVILAVHISIQGEGFVSAFWSASQPFRCPATMSPPFPSQYFFIGSPPLSTWSGPTL